MKNGNYCDCNRKNAIKFGGFKKKVVPLTIYFIKTLPYCKMFFVKNTTNLDRFLGGRGLILCD